MKQKSYLMVCVAGIIALFAFKTYSPENVESESLGTYSLSLNVQDIAKSSSFYQKLGFVPVQGMGSEAKKWMILSNGKTKIGLFQGFFPRNTMTFNPIDGRALLKELKEQGIQPVFKTGFDQKEGPCSFSITDPDNNPILIDQH